MLRKKFKKILTISMAFSMLFSNNAFATPIDLVNSTESVVTDTLNKSDGTDHFADEDTNVWANGEIPEEVRVRVDVASEFEITIPKEIVLDGETGKADYKVKAVGDIAGDQKLSVVPDSDFVLSEAGGKTDVTAIVTQPDTEYVYTDLQGDGTDYNGNITATLSAGEWSGKFTFNIKFKESSLNSEEDIIENIPVCTYCDIELNNDNKGWENDNVCKGCENLCDECKTFSQTNCNNEGCLNYTCSQHYLCDNCATPGHSYCYDNNCICDANDNMECEEYVSYCQNYGCKYYICMNCYMSNGFSMTKYTMCVGGDIDCQFYICQDCVLSPSENCNDYHCKYYYIR